MKRLILDCATKIEVNGHTFLLEAGDSILIKEETIEDKREKLQDLYMYVRKAAEELQDIEDKLDIRYDQELDDQRRKLQKKISIANRMINSIEAELAGYGKKRMAKLAADIIAQQKKPLMPTRIGATDTPEEDKIRLINSEIATVQNEYDEIQGEIEEIMQKMESADEDEARRLQYRLDQLEDEKLDYENRLNELEELRDQYLGASRIGRRADDEEAQRIERAIEYEKEYGEDEEREDEEKEGEEAEAEAHGLTIKTPEELEKLPPDEEEYLEGYRSSIDIAFGDELSQKLIDIGFQPSQLGLYSDMLESQASA